VPSLLAKRDAPRAFAALLALAGLLASSVVLSGCGASATLDPVARAAEVSSQQTGIHFTLSVRFSASALPTSNAAIEASGYVNERERSGEMTMSLSGLPASAGSTSLGGLEHMHMIFRYPTVYVGLPALAGKLPEGKTWMKLDLKQIAQAHGVQLPQLSSLNETNPSEFLRYLRASGGAVTRLGEEVVNGVPTTHYRATLSLARILDSYPAADRAAARSALSALGSAGAIPVDVWVDRQSRVRRMTMSIQVPLPAGVAGATEGQGTTGSGALGATITVDFTSYGEVPPVVPPPAAEVFDATALEHAGLSGGYGEQSP
jgi:hypothetical protein